MYIYMCVCVCININIDLDMRTKGGGGADKGEEEKWFNLVSVLSNRFIICYDIGELV